MDSILDLIQDCISKSNEEQFTKFCEALDKHSVTSQDTSNIEKTVDEIRTTQQMMMRDIQLLIDPSDYDASARPILGADNEDSDSPESISKRKLFIDGKEKTLEDTLHDINAAVNPTRTRPTNTMYAQNSVIKQTQKLTDDLTKRQEEAPRLKRLAVEKELSDNRAASAFASQVSQIKKGQQTSIGLANKTRKGLQKVSNGISLLRTTINNIGAKGSVLYDSLQGILTLVLIGLFFPAIVSTLKFVFAKFLDPIANDLKEQFPAVFEWFEKINRDFLSQWGDPENNQVDEAVDNSNAGNDSYNQNLATTLKQKVESGEMTPEEAIKELWNNKKKVFDDDEIKQQKHTIKDLNSAMTHLGFTAKHKSALLGGEETVVPEQWIASILRGDYSSLPRMDLFGDDMFDTNYTAILQGGDSTFGGLFSSAVMELGKGMAKLGGRDIDKETRLLYGQKLADAAMHPGATELRATAIKDLTAVIDHYNKNKKFSEEDKEVSARWGFNIDEYADSVYFKGGKHTITNITNYVTSVQATNSQSTH